MKKFIILLLVVVVIGLIILVISSGAPSDLPEGQVSDVNNEQTISNVDYTKSDIIIESFNFTGYGPGKSHVGTFESFTLSKGVEGESLGKIVFKTDSVTTDTDAVTKHLCTDDFFDCAKNPEITFTAKNVEKVSDSSVNLSGVLSFRGVEKTLTFPVNVSGDTFNADFRVDITPFTFKFIGIDDEVRIQFNGKAVESI